MERKSNFMEERERKEYLSPQIEVVEVMVEKGFGEGDLGSGSTEGGGPVINP